ncbi:MAG: hypothetical protein ACR2P7_04425, partial [bacterium]
AIDGRRHVFRRPFFMSAVKPRSRIAVTVRNTTDTINSVTVLNPNRNDRSAVSFFARQGGRGESECAYMNT